MDIFFILSVVICFIFAFFNGFSDAANSISTVVATRVLKPFQAVILAAIGNFLGIFLGTAVAETIGQGIVESDFLSLQIIFAGISGGMIFDFGTWFLGLPISESHVMIGGLMGAAAAASSLYAVQFDVIWHKVVVPMVFSPVISFCFAAFLIIIVVRIFKNVHIVKMNRGFRWAQVISAFFLSVAHGTNDAQKAVGLLIVILIKQGIFKTFHTPLWLSAAVFSTVALGTLLGGWRIVKTMAKKITHLLPYQGFCAETGSAIVLVASARVGFPVSTTHAISGAICGVGVTKSSLAVKWDMAKKIVFAWLLTIPLSAVFSFVVYKICDFILF